MYPTDTPPSVASTVPRFHWLRVAKVRQETPDAISVTFDVPAGLAAQYAFRAGQYLTLRITLDGEEVRRSYSICAGEDDGELRIAIKRVAGGAFSEWAQQALRPGVAIEVMTPTGRFGIPPITCRDKCGDVVPDAPPASWRAQARHPRLAGGDPDLQTSFGARGPLQPVVGGGPAPATTLEGGPESALPAAGIPEPALPAARVRDSARVHVAIAAGSGITPVLSIMRTVLAREPHSHFFLFYGSRSSTQILFRGEIEDLKDRHLGRLSVFHVLSREQQDVDVLNGRLDQDKLALLLRRMLGGTAIDAAYVCGPTGMIAGVEATLSALGVPADRVHVERFTSALGGRPRPPRPIAPAAPPHAIATVIVDGVRSEIPVAEGEAVLDAALRAGIELPYACKGGMCCSCRARLLEGSAEMAVNYSLEPREIEAGFVLTCQAQPTSARVVLDYDQR